MERTRTRTRTRPAIGQTGVDTTPVENGQPQPRGVHPLGTPHGMSPNTGPLATAAWLLARSLFPKERAWSVVIVLAAGDARFELEIFAEEWGFAFHHGDRMSWIRVTDIPFVHGRDDFELLPHTSSLRDIAKIVRLVENQFQLAFDRDDAVIHTNIDGAEPAIRAWVAEL